MNWMNMRSVFSVFSSDLALDLGSCNTQIFVKGKGIAINEPSVVAVNRLNGSVEAVGTAAKEMVGRAPENIAAIFPLRNSVIADYETAEKMLAYFIRTIHNRSFAVRPRVLIAVPSKISQVEKRAVKDAAFRAKASEVFLVEKGTAAAVGCDLPVTGPSGSIIVDIGGGTTEVSILSMGSTVFSKTIHTAGNQMDEAITNYIRKKYNLLIGETTAEMLKVKLGSAFPLGEELVMEIRGRALILGIPKTLVISDEEIRLALSESVAAIVDAVRDSLEVMPPELSGDIVDRGIIMIGGGSLLRNMEKRLREETGLTVNRASDPTTAVVTGCSKILEDSNLLKRFAIN
jgi:rod shape-determining protein MreB